MILKELYSSHQKGNEVPNGGLRYLHVHQVDSDIYFFLRDCINECIRRQETHNEFI